MRLLTNSLGCLRTHFLTPRRSGSAVNFELCIQHNAIGLLGMVNATKIIQYIFTHLFGAACQGIAVTAATGA